MAFVGVRVILGSVLVAGGIAGSAPAASAAEPQTTINFKVVSQGTGVPRTATLTCDPVGGTHPEAATVCAELAKVDGDVRQVPPRPGRFCLSVWIPVDATASGYWRGRMIGYAETITNDGCARIAHGHALDF